MIIIFVGTINIGITTLQSTYSDLTVIGRF